MKRLPEKNQNNISHSEDEFDYQADRKKTKPLKRQPNIQPTNPPMSQDTPKNPYSETYQPIKQTDDGHDEDDDIYEDEYY
jgi:hypothetical protein